MNVPSWSVGVYSASICATLQDVFIILDVRGRGNAYEPTAPQNTIRPLDSKKAGRQFQNVKSVPVYLLLKPTGAESRCVWRAMHPDTLSAVGLKKTGC